MMNYETLLLNELQRASQNGLIKYSEMFFSESTGQEIRTFQVTFSTKIPQQNITNLFHHLKKNYNVFGIHAVCKNIILFSFKQK